MNYRDRSIDETYGILYKFIEQRSNEFTKIITHSSIGRYDIELIEKDLK